MSRAIAYLRVSTVEQVNEGVSLEAQEKRIRAWCEAQDTPLVDVFVDAGVSGGRIDNRPELQRALGSCKRSDVLVVYSLSRLSRTTRDVLAIMDQLRSRGVDVVSLSEKIDTSSASGKLTFHLMAIIGEFERDVISERTRMAIQHLQRQARYTGGHRPFGWEVNGDGTLAPNLEESRLLIRAQELRRSGLGYRRIASALCVECAEQQNGRRFHPEQIRRWIQSLRPLGLIACAAPDPDAPDNKLSQKPK